jgi:DNA-binding transcriptional ArsR family regulator
MANLLPGGEVEEADEEPRVLGLDDEDADDVLGALSSETARDLLTAVHEEPATASELAAAADTSLQNAQYHIEKLEAAGLIEVRGTRYSAKGREMAVYGPNDSPLVLFAGERQESEGIRTALTTFLGSVALLAGVAVLVQVALRGLPFGESGGGAGGSGGDTASVQTLDAASQSADAAATASGLPPGLLVFLGGLVALAAVAGVRYARD